MNDNVCGHGNIWIDGIFSVFQEAYPEQKQILANSAHYYKKKRKSKMFI